MLEAVLYQVAILQMEKRFIYGIKQIVPWAAYK
jgi:hypothetical protein